MRLSIQDLAMFYGCSINSDWYGWEGKIMDAAILREIEEDHKCHTIKPILRNLSDMTENEELILRQFRVYNFSEGKKRWNETAESLKILISLRFDVFGWINKGLAINQ